MAEQWRKWGWESCRSAVKSHRYTWSRKTCSLHAMSLRFTFWQCRPERKFIVRNGRVKNRVVGRSSCFLRNESSSTAGQCQWKGGRWQFHTYMRNTKTKQFCSSYHTPWHTHQKPWKTKNRNLELELDWTRTEKTTPGDFWQNHHTGLSYSSLKTLN